MIFRMSEKLLIKPSICIPIYKSELNKFEIISIKSHIFKLKAHDIFLLVPKSKKNDIIQSLRNNDISDSFYRIHEVNDYCLERYEHYNYLLLSPSFYKFYKSYSHVLIAQIDAYTFSDKLLHWCKTDLHYIGAPCYKFGNYWVNEVYFCGIGGFSLREIKKTLEVLREDPIIFDLNDLQELSKSYSLKGKLILFLKYLFTIILRKNRLKRDIKNHRHTSRFINLFIFINEDVSFGYYLPKHLTSFKVGDFNQSVNFCIDWNVKKLLKKISYRLPFGAHGWFNYPENLKEWGKHIKID